MIENDEQNCDSSQTLNVWSETAVPGCGTGFVPIGRQSIICCDLHDIQIKAVSCLPSSAIEDPKPCNVSPISLALQIQSTR